MKQTAELTIPDVIFEYTIDESDFLSRVSDYKIPQLKNGKFKRSIIEKYFQKRDLHAYESHVIAVSNQKGGEGKTTISIFLSEALSRSSKVLLVDWDPQANASRLFLNETEHSVFDCLNYRDNSAIPMVKVIRNVKENFDIAPSSISLANLTTPYERDDFELLKESLLPVRSSYEYIIIDCPPSLGLGLENALIAADYVLIPIQSRAFSVQGLKDLHSTIEKIKKKANPGLELLGAVLNQYEDSRALSGLSGSVKKYFPVFDTIIYRRESIPQSQAKRTLLSNFDKKTMGSFLSLADEVRGRILVEKK